MKVTLLLSLALFSNVTFAEDFYARYLQQSSDCTSQAKAAQQMSTYWHCVGGAVRTVKSDPYFAADEENANIIIDRFTKRAVAWEQYEDSIITKTELNIILGKIDRNE